MEYRYPLWSKRVRCRCKDARMRQYFMEPALAEKLETVVTRGIATHADAITTTYIYWSV